MACYREPLAWLTLAIDSILQQTLGEIELIVVIDDPNNTQICDFLNQKQLTDKRLVVLKNSQNMGLPHSLNTGIDHAKAELVARMDADDISLPQRLKMQYDYMQTHPDVSLLGSAIENIDDNGESLGITEFQSAAQVIKKIIPYCSVACHPTWMFRKSLFDSVGRYRMLQGAEDYDLLYRILDAGGNITNLSTPLLKYRLHSASITSGMNLKRYKVRHYIIEMHMQRLALGRDEYSPIELQTRLAQQKDSNLVTFFLTKLRRYEASKSIKRLYCLAALFFVSSHVRGRIIDHIKLAFILKSVKSEI